MKRRSPIKTLFQMLKLVRPLSLYMLLAITAGTLAYLAVQFIPVFGTYGILNIIGLYDKRSLSSIFVILIVLALSRSVLRYIEQRSNHYIAFTILAIIRDKVFRALRRLSPAKLCGRDKGDLISLITADIELLEVFYAHTISPIFIAICVETIMVIFISTYSIIEGLFALIAFVTVGVITPVIIYRISGDTADQMRNKAGELSAYVLENIRGLNETIQYDLSDDRRKGVTDKTTELTVLKRKLSDLTGLNAAVANTMILLADLIVLLCGVTLYQNGNISFEGLIISQVALMSSFGPVFALSALGSTLQNTIASCNRVLDVLEEEPETKDITGKEKTEYQDVKIKDLCFAYDDNEVLKDLNMSFEANRIIGILGRSGSGKSTLLRLLMRFWKKDSGQISISDKDIEQINTTDLRDMESYMAQEGEFFKDTIRNNIRIAKLDASDEEIIDACKKASIHNFIMSLKDGYDSKIAELGDSLSDGEKQRLNLARVFLHDAPLVLLDEPTSNLDSLNEAMILRSLKQESKDKTIVLVSHRKSTMRIADKTYSVENGRMS